MTEASGRKVAGKGMKPSNGFAGAVLATLGGHVTIMLLGVVSGVVTARGLGPDARGVLVALLVYSGAVGAISMLGLDEGVIYVASGHPRLAIAVRDALRAASLRNSMVGGGTLAAISCYIIVRTHSGWADFIAIGVMFAYIYFNNRLMLNLGCLRVSGRVAAWNIMRIVPQLVYVMLIAAAAATNSLSVTSASAALLTGVVVSLAISTRLLSGPLESRATSQQVAQARRFGKGLVLALIPAFLNLRLDQLILAVAWPSEVLGVYAVAASLAAIVAGLGWAAEAVLFPRLSKAVITSSALLRIGACLFGISAVGALLLSLVGERLIVFAYGREYSEASEALLWLCLSASVTTVTGVAGSLLKVRAMMRQIFVAHAAGTVTLVASMPLLMSKMGIEGVGIASLASALVTATVMVVASSRSQSVTPRAAIIADQEAADVRGLSGSAD